MTRFPSCRTPSHTIPSRPTSLSSETCYVKSFSRYVFVVYLHGDCTSPYLQKFSNAAMLAPLVQRMVNRNPEQRPSASEVLREWKAIRRGTSRIQRYWRLRPREELWIATPWLDLTAGVSGLFPGALSRSIVTVVTGSSSQFSDGGIPSWPGTPNWISPPRQVVSMTPFASTEPIPDVQCSLTLSLLFGSYTM